MKPPDSESARVRNFSFRKLHWLYAVLFFTILSILIYRIPLLQNDPHYLEVSRDLRVPIYLDNLVAKYYPMWNGPLSTTNFVASFQMPVITVLGFAKLFAWPPMTAVEVIMIIGTALTGFFGYFATYSILSKTYGFSKSLFFASLLSGAFFVINPQWAADPRHYGRKIADAFVPLVFVLFWLGLRDKRLSYVLGGTCAMMLASGGPRNVFTGAFLIVFLALYAFVTEVVSKKPSWRETVKCFLTHLKYVIVASIFYVLFTAYRLFPLGTRIFSAGFPKPYLITVESAQAATQNATLLNALRFDIYPRHHPYLNPPSFMPSPQFLMILGLVVFFAALAVVFIGPLNRDTVLLLISLAFWTLFSTGVNPFGFPFVSDLYYWLILDAPLHQYYFWAFRKPIQFWILPTMFAGILLGFLSVKIFNRITNLRVPRRDRLLSAAMLILLISAILLPSWPMFTGNFGGVLQPVRVPEEYFSINEWLRNQAGDFKVLWMPIYRAANVSWIQEQVPGLGDALYLKSFEMISSSRETFGVWITSSKGRPVESYLMFLLSMDYGYPFDVMQSNRTVRLGSLLAHLNVRYLVLSTEIPPLMASHKVRDVLESQFDLRLVHQEGGFNVYENNEFNPHVHATSSAVLVEGGKETFTALSNLEDFDASTTSLFFLDQQLGWDESLFPLSDMVILHDWRNLLPLVAPHDVVSLTRYTVYEDYHLHWGKAETSDIRYGRWTPVLASQGIPNWDFDYGLGLVFTDRPDNSLSFRVKIDRDDEYIALLRYLPSRAGGQFRVLMDGLEISTTQTKSDAARFALLELKLERVTAGEHTITIQNVMGFNAFNYLMLVSTQELASYRNEIVKKVENKNMVFLELPGLDFQRVNVTLTNAYGGRAMNGEALQYARNGVASTFLETIRPKKYVIAIGTPTRELGTLMVQIANYSLRVEINGTSRFVYTPPIYLEEKRYALMICQMSGTPVVDGVFIYEAENQLTVNELLKRDVSTTILSFEELDPTSYSVEAVAKTPFWLLLAESYDPNWVAYVDGHPISSVLSYQSINGFPINRTGKLQIRIEFVLQSFFYYGSVIVVAALVVASILIVRGLRKRESAETGKFIDDHVQMRPFLRWG